ncbi:MAG: tRNA 2-thiouridine(34) synthase MnmA, partial [Dethiobacteria bacterium]
MAIKGKVLVAMSGGVDSSVAAALLKKQGYDVIGVTMRLWFDPGAEDESEKNARGCCPRELINDALRVANKLEIPHYVLNLKEDFQKYVVDYFVKGYLEGRTPNPCIACNCYVKFDILLKKALALGADYIATGHYARSGYDREKKRYYLKKSCDLVKDQTYMLYNLTQKQLSHTLFPLGDFRKEEIRRLAKEFGLSVADKPDSQEICFIPGNDYRSFLRRMAPDSARPGPIADRSGRRLGTHKGVSFYTVGQRKGLGLATGTPMYVTDIIPERNTVVVGPRSETYSIGLIAGDLNLIAFDKLPSFLEARVKIRYNAPEIPAQIRPFGAGE